MPPYQSDVFEYVQVMREQVRAHPQPLAQFTGRGLTPGEGVHDRQAAGIAEGGVHGRSPPQLFVHLMFLIGFRSKIAVLVDWAYAYIIYRPGARIIMGHAKEA